MKVLVVGGGAREHALCWKLRQSPLLKDLYCAPGNPGIARLADRVPVAPEEIQRLADFAGALALHLTIVPPELPLTLPLPAHPPPPSLPPSRPTHPSATAQDSQRIGEGDSGVDAGGVGSQSAAGLVSAETGADIVEAILRPTVEGMAEEGRPFAGVLYAGIMLTAEGPKVLEFNARFGDPEAQVLLLRVEDDLLPVLASAAAGALDTRRLRFRKEAAACVGLDGPRDPARPQVGEPVRSLQRG